MIKFIRILLFIAGGLLLITIVSGFLFWLTKNTESLDYKKEHQVDAKPSSSPLKTYQLPLFVKKTIDVNRHSFKIRLSLAYENNYFLSKELQEREDEIQHIINILLQGKRYDDIDSANDAIALAESIKAHLNVRLNNGKIKEVYFKEFMID